jgi:hypothetical protein
MLRLSTSAFSFTPARSMPLAGYVQRSGAHEGIDGDLEAVFLLLSDQDGNRILIGGVDTLFLTEASLSDVKDALGNVQMPLFLFATHTHNAPSLAPDLPGLGRHDPEWYRHFVSGCARTIKELVARQNAGQPVTVGYGKQQTELSVNRRLPSRVLDYPALLHQHRLIFERRIALAENKDGFVDPYVYAIFLEDSRDTVRGIIWSLAVHPARYPRFNRVSPDFPGLIRDALRRRFGKDCAVLYVPGFAGSAVPSMARHLPTSWKELCLKILPFYPLSLPVDAATYQDWVNRLLTAMLGAYAAREDSDDASGIAFSHGSTADIFRSHKKGSDIGLRIARVSLGDDLNILGFNGEMLGEWMPLLSSVITGKVLFSGYMAGRALYVPTSPQIPEGGYEVTGFQNAFGLDGEFDPDISEKVTSATAALYRRTA